MSFRTSLWTVRRVLGSLATTYEDRETLVFPDADPPTRWTGREFGRELNRVAHGYRHLGLEQGDRVGLIGLTTPEFFVAFFAATTVGVVPCNFNPRESGDRLATLGERFDPDALVYDPRHAAKADHITRSVSPGVRISLSGADEGGSVAPTHGFAEVRSMSEADPEAPPDVPVARDDTAFVNWSTGTTGVPKGLVWTNEGAVAAGAINARLRNTTHEDVRVNYSTPGFVGWFYASFSSLVAGSTLVFMESYDPERYLELIGQEGVTEFGGVSTPVQMALDTLETNPETYDVSSVESAYYVGEPMKQETIERVESLVTPNIDAIYGTTEATGLTAIESGDDDPTALSDRVPLVEARAVELREDEQAPPDARVDVGERGELIIRSPGRAERVLDDPELTDHIFRDGWWYSGDVVERLESGAYRIAGRTDDMIISGGINVFPSLVEDVLSAHPAVAGVAVVGLPDDQWGQRVVAAVRVEPGQRVDADDLDAHCLADPDLPRHARPREYFFWDGEEFPKTPTGKIYRSELEAQLEERTGVRPSE